MNKMSEDVRFKNLGGETCQNCGKVFKMVYDAPNHLWDMITGEDCNLLCPECFDETMILLFMI